VKVIIKADDLAGYPGKTKAIPKRWQKFVDIIEKYNIKATIGVIGNSLLFDDKEYFTWIKDYHKKGFIEFWNHGFLHRQFDFDGKKLYKEFKGTSYKYQLKLINYTNKLAKDKLGFDFVTFGSPYNAKDKNTIKALNNSDIRYWFGIDKKFHGKCISKRLDIEYPTHIINFKQFKKNLKKYDYAILQVHPNSWDKKSFKEFEQIIKVLLKKDAIFILAKDI